VAQSRNAFNADASADPARDQPLFVEFAQTRRECVFAQRLEFAQQFPLTARARIQGAKHGGTGVTGDLRQGRDEAETDIGHPPTTSTSSLDRPGLGALE